MNPRTILVVATLALWGNAVAQDSRPSAKPTVEAELRKMFDRPAGTPISEAQKANLGEFIERHGRDNLHEFGYAEALHRYLNRDYPGAIEASDEYFEKYSKVPIAEHGTMLGRIAMTGMMQADSSADRARLGARAVRLYPDVRTLSRALPRALEGLDEDGQRKVRLEFARAVLESSHSDADQETLLRQLFGATDPAARAADATIPALPIRTQRGAGDRAQNSAATRDGLTGHQAPALAVDAVVGGADDLSLESLRGKVVVLDFTATWCGPCRKIIPNMISMQKEHDGDLQVIGVTRLYTYGAAFDDDGGSTRVSDLDRSAEIALNEDFRSHMGINYPVAIVSQDNMGVHYGVQGIPTVFVVGRDGKVVGHAVGATDAAHAAVEKMVTEALRR